MLNLAINYEQYSYSMTTKLRVIKQHFNIMNKTLTQY